MSKITLSDVASGYNLSAIKDNFDKIEDELNNKVLYRNNPPGEPNSLATDVDANGRRIFNLPAPLSASEPARLVDLNNSIIAATNAQQYATEALGYKNDAEAAAATAISSAATAEAAKDVAVVSEANALAYSEDAYDNSRLTVGVVTTGAPGSPAAVTIDGLPGTQVIDFTIPEGLQGIQGIQGTQGIQGDEGRGIVSVVRTSGTGGPGTTDTYTITYNDATTSTFDVYNGADGTGSGDVSGPASSVDDRIATFDGLTGKIIQDGGQTIAEVIAAAVASVTPSGLVLLDTKTASNSATLDFISSIDSTYDQYVFEITALVPASSSQIRFITSANNGSSWDNAASNYADTIIYNTTAGTSASTGTTGAANARLCFNSVDNTSSQGGMNARLVLKNPASTTQRKSMSFQSDFPTNTTTGYAFETGQATRLATAVINGVRFYASTGNLSTGVIRMYGVKK